MITLEMLYTSSTKARQEEVLADFKAAGALDKFMECRRHPDTCFSRVLSIAEVDGFWFGPKRFGTAGDTGQDYLASSGGICCYAVGPIGADTHVFMTDDAMFGWKILKELGWHACSFRHCGTAHKNFQSWREHLTHFYPGAKVIESNEQLLKLLNEGDPA